MSNGVQRAKIEKMHAFFNDDFAINLACEKLNLTLDELEKICGRYTRGKYKGQLRYCLAWDKVVVGGWKVDGYGAGNGHVEKPGHRFNYRIVDIFQWDNEKNDYKIIPYPDEIIKAHIERDTKKYHQQHLAEYQAEIKKLESANKSYNDMLTRNDWQDKINQSNNDNNTAALFIESFKKDMADNQAKINEFKKCIDLANS